MPAVSAAHRRKTRSKSPEMFEIPAPNFKHVEVSIIHDTPLVVKRFGTKTVDLLLAGMMGKPVAKRAPKDPDAEYEDALYVIPSGNGRAPKARTAKTPRRGGRQPKRHFGFPATAFKKAMASAGYRYLGLKDKVSVLGALYIYGQDTDDGPLVEIVGTPRMRRDVVRLKNGAPDIRFRPEFRRWKCKLLIRYNANFINPAKIMHLLNTAGHSVGIGEGRPEKGGQWGMFHVSGRPRDARARKIT